MKRILSTAVFSLVLLSAPWLQAAQYKIDSAHSSVSFSIKHMMVSKTTGKFDKFEGEFAYDEKDPNASTAKAMIDAASIDTGNDKRDGHLKSPDFFDVANFPTLSFQSSKVALQDGKGKLYGLLTMHGITKPVVLDLEFGGVMTGMGGTRAGFEAKGRLNRKDFGIVWNKTLDNGGVAVGEDVDLVIQIEGVQQVAGGDKPMEKKPADKK